MQSEIENKMFYQMLPYLGLIVLGGVGMLNTIGVVNLSGDVPMLHLSGYLCLIICGFIGIKYDAIECLGFGLVWFIAVVAIPKYIELIPLEPRLIQYIAIAAGALTMLRLAKIVAARTDNEKVNRV
ncbi:hypothetical protein ABRZ80_20555 [Vibrio vulnificus]|uniref:hypothetical protein n=1 Tax=Vibrio vulnificus TaxID=672 RepID=UPI0032EB0623